MSGKGHSEWRSKTWEGRMVSFNEYISHIRSRRETFYVICQSIANIVKIVNGQTFPYAFFLVIFGLLWYQTASFDTEFFTIAFVLISYLRNTYLNNFSSAFTNLTQYWVAAKRIEVIQFDFIWNVSRSFLEFLTEWRIWSISCHYLWLKQWKHREWRLHCRCSTSFILLGGKRHINVV